jgi:hypothetical protein
MFFHVFLKGAFVGVTQGRLFLKKKMAKNTRGVSLTEIIIAMVLLAAVMLGITNVFISGTRMILHSRSRITSAEAGNFYFAPLQNDVRQDTWNAAGNKLAVGSRSGDPPKIDLDGIEYNGTYAVSDYSGMRKVKLTVQWEEHNPF